TNNSSSSSSSSIIIIVIIIAVIFDIIITSIEIVIHMLPVVMSSFVRYLLRFEFTRQITKNDVVATDFHGRIEPLSGEHIVSFHGMADIEIQMFVDMCLCPNTNDAIS